jgi:hypothetical protein
MTTRLVTAGAILVFAIIFSFIFWNQFTSNQRQLAGNPGQSTNNATVSQTPTPANDSAASIESDLNSIDINGIDSDSSQFTTSLNGF